MSKVAVGVELVPEAEWSLGTDLIIRAGPRCSGRVRSPDNQRLFLPSSPLGLAAPPPSGCSTRWAWEVWCLLDSSSPRRGGVTSFP